MMFTLMDTPPAGLGEGEAAVTLDGGEVVAVCASSRWLAHNGGGAFVASARWIDESGETKLCPNGQPIRTEASHNADPVSIQQHGVAAISREMMLAVLGAAPTLIAREGADGPFEAPLLMHGEEWRTNASIRHAIDVAMSTAPIHAAVLLKL